MKKPLGVLLISYFYIFGAIFLLLTAFFYHSQVDSIGIAERFGIQNVSERLMRIIVAFVSFGMVFGYIRLKKWGFWFMVIYSVVFGFISASLVSSQHSQPFMGNTIWSISVLIYTIFVKKHFFKKNFQQ